MLDGDLYCLSVICKYKENPIQVANILIFWKYQTENNTDLEEGPNDKIRVPESNAI